MIQVKCYVCQKKMYTITGNGGDVNDVCQDCYSKKCYKNGEYVNLNTLKGDMSNGKEKVQCLPQTN